MSAQTMRLLLVTCALDVVVTPLTRADACVIPTVPIIFCKAIPLEKQDLRGTYSCPTFKTVERGRAQEAVAVGLCPGFVWYFNLKTKVHPNKWVLAGCAMTLSD